MSNILEIDSFNDNPFEFSTFRRNFNTLVTDDIESCKNELVLISTKDVQSYEIKQNFCNFSQINPILKVVNIGYIDQWEDKKVEALFMALLANNCTIVLLSHNKLIVKCLLNAFAIFEKPYSVAYGTGCTFDNYTKDMTFDWLFDHKKTWLFNASFLGLQIHRSEPAVLSEIETQNCDSIRLGALKNDIEKAEPLIRDAEISVLNTSILKYADCPSSSCNSSGLTSEELCTLSRYAGMNDKLKAFVLTGYDDFDPASRQVTSTLSQALWYFFQGYSSRKNDYPVNADILTEYNVQTSLVSNSIKFYKSESSGRWWIKPFDQLKEGYENQALVACNYEDYLSATQNELSPSLLKIYSRFQSISK